MTWHDINFVSLSVYSYFLVLVSKSGHDGLTGGATIYSARSIKIKEEDGFRWVWFQMEYII